MATLTTKKGHTFHYDDSEEAKVESWKWHSVEKPGGKVFARNVTVGYLHNLLAGAMTGEVVEMIDGDYFNLRSANLRKMSRSELQRRVHEQLSAKNPRRYIRPDKDGRYSVLIPRVGYIGRRDTIEEAMQLRDEFLA